MEAGIHTAAPLKQRVAEETKMEWVVWEALPTGNACILEAVENIEKSSRVERGVTLAATWPKDAIMRMTKRHKKNTALLDDVSSYSSAKVCSPRLVEFLRSKRLENVEYLPITILDHRDQVASKDYCIVHPIHPQDALDVQASQAEYDAIVKTDIESVARIVLDEGRLDSRVQLFRLNNFFTPVLLAKAIADEITAKAFKGSYFRTLDEYRT